jgi:hypothetical protein
MKAISYSPQKDIFKGVLHNPIKDHLGRSEIFNLTINPYLDHNSCIISLNEQYEGILSIYILRPFQWHFEGAQVGICVPFQPWLSTLGTPAQM